MGGEETNPNPIIYNTGSGYAFTTTESNLTLIRVLFMKMSAYFQ